MPTAAESAAILRAAMDSGFDPVRLRMLQSQRAGELSDRFANDLGTNDIASARRDKFLMGDLEGDMSSDPYTGDAEQKRIAGITDTLDSAAMLQRPEMQDASETSARRNAFAQFLLGKSKYQAEGSPEAQRVLDAASQRKVAENDASAGGKLAAALTLKAATDAGRPLPAAEENQVKALHQQSALAEDVLPVVRKLADAQDEFNQSTYGKLAGWMTQIPGIAGAAQSAWQNLLYRHGLADEDVAAASQRLGLAQAVGITSFAGRPTGAWIELLSQHQAVPGLPWREQERRLTSMIQDTTGMPAILPRMEQAIYDSHGGRTRLSAQPGGGDVSDQNWGQR